MVRHKDGALQGLQQAHLPDVGVGVVDEDAGVHIAIGVDVEVAPPAGDAAAHILRVVLEVHGEEGLLRPELPDAAIDRLPLLRGGQQLRRGVVAHGHVVEVPDEVGPHPDELVVVLLRGDGVVVRAGVAGGDAVEELPLMQQLHGVDHLPIGPLAPAAVGGGLVPLQGDGGHEVPHPQHLVSESLVDEGGVGEAEEDAVVVLLAEPDEVLLPYQGLAAGVDIHVDAHLLALADDIVDLVKAQVQLVAVLRRPAAGAVEIAGGGGVQQDGPGDVAVVLLAVGLLPVPADEVGVQEEVGRHGLHDLGVHVVHHMQDVVVVGVLGVLDGRPDGGPLALELAVRELVRPVHDVPEVLLRVLIEVVEGLLQAHPLQCGGNAHIPDPSFSPALRPVLSLYRGRAQSPGRGSLSPPSRSRPPDGMGAPRHSPFPGKLPSPSLPSL